jgi:predicted N-acetyltransferase YhbS
MSIDYEINPGQVDPKEVADLYRDAGLRRPVDDLARMERMLKNANITVTAREGGRLVGIARGLTDFSYVCYLADLAVAAAHQRAGIGKQLMERMREHLGDEVTLLLLAAPTAAEYYPHVGFEKIENGWIIHRKK